ncbi:DUF983 domain-containing protein [Phenylobacterium sp.]|jgi:uncharacterized protein (DUF983 family)|uniref:DUF983 domain-containing protein n=1 Tax=Phenylobacterium sp. TaxID=1871053 RepID=UPI002F932D56
MTEIRHPVGPSVSRGLKHRCPACGKGALFRKYLKVAERCEVCDLDLQRYPADDGPAYLTILLVGHLIVAPLFFFPIVWESPAYLSLPILLGSLSVITLMALPRIKGGWIGLMYAIGVTDREARLHTADVAD